MPDPSFFLPLLLQSAVIPFLVAGTVTVAALVPQKTEGTQPITRSVPYAPVLAIVLGFLASYFATLHAQWSPMPEQAHDLLPWILAAAVPCVILSERLKSSGSRLAVRAMLAVGAIALMAWPAVPSVGALMFGTVVVSAAALVWAVWTLLMSATTQRTALLPVAIISGAAALALVLDSSQLIGQLTGALTAVLGALIIVTLLRPQNIPPGIAAGIAVLLLGVLLANAYLYAGFPLLIIACLAAGLLTAAIVLALARRHILSACVSIITAVALCAVYGLIAVALAIEAAQDAGGY